jgi:hypothetical protein
LRRQSHVNFPDEGFCLPTRTGTSENTAFVDTSLQVWNASQLDEVFGPFNNRANTAIGEDWYVLAGNLPAGTEFTFGLNLYDQSQVAAQTKMLAEAFQGSRAHLTKDVTLKFIEIGNEPNFYFPSAASYVSQWKRLARTVLQNIKMSGNGNPTFWIGSEVVGFGPSFQLTGTLEAGILDDDDIARANFVLGEHQYSGNLNIGAIPGGPLPGTLMNKASIRGNLSTVYSGLLNTQSYRRTYYLVGKTLFDWICIVLLTYVIYREKPTLTPCMLPSNRTFWPGWRLVADHSQIVKPSLACPTRANRPCGRLTTCSRRPRWVSTVFTSTAPPTACLPSSSLGGDLPMAPASIAHTSCRCTTAFLLWAR